MAAALQQLLRLKGIPGGLGYARRPAPTPPPAAPLGLRTFTSNAGAYKTPPLTRTSPGMYHWRHGKMVRSDVKIVSLVDDHRRFRFLLLGIDGFFIASCSFMLHKIITS